MAAIGGYLESITPEQLDADPYPIWKRLRHEAPIAFVPSIQLWTITRFDDVAAVLRGEHGFGSATSQISIRRTTGDPQILLTTGEEHRDLRVGVDRRLAPRPVRQVVEESVRPIAREYIRRLVARGEAELVSEYFEPVSVEALRHVLGLDALVDTATLVRWFYQLAAGTANIVQDPAIYELSDQANREINQTLLPHMEKLSHQPDDSMISHMLWAGREGATPRQISQILPTLKIILVGGMQEPGHAAASTLYGLFGRPDQWELLLNDPEEWVPLAIGEGLRWIAPIGSVNRQAEHDTTVRGVIVPKGALVQAVLASANRDGCSSSGVR